MALDKKNKDSTKEKSTDDKKNIVASGSDDQGGDNGVKNEKSAKPRKKRKWEGKTLNVVKGIGKKKEPIKKRGSKNGVTPFFRWGLSMLLAIVVSLIVSIGSYFGIIVVEPTVFIVPSDTFLWILSTVVAPYVINFFLVVLFTTFIMTQSTMKYSLWVVSQGMKSHIFWLIMAVSMGVIIVGLAYESSYINAPNNTATTLHNITEISYVMVCVLSIIVSWIAYRSAWSSYRTVGAQTMQQRYEKDVANMEIDHTGQWWDRFLIKHLKSIFGLDGEKPRGFFVYFAFTLIVSVINVSFASYYENVVFLPMALIGAPVSVVALLSAIAKYRDGKFNRKKQSYLTPVRFPDTVDDYNPASKGVRQFVSK